MQTEDRGSTQDLKALVEHGEGPALVWRVLEDDVPCPVMAFNDEGRLVFANQAAARMLVVDRSRLVGMMVGDVHPAPFAGERLSLVRRVIASARPVMLVEMIRGRWSRTTIRRVMMPSGAPAAVMVIQVGVPGRTPTEVAGAYDVIEARYQDLGPLEGLTKRELEILRMVGEGMTTAEIAKLLNRTAKTVEWHRASLGRKLGASSRVGLAQIAIAAGLAQLVQLPHVPRRAGGGGRAKGPGSNDGLGDGGAMHGGDPVRRTPRPKPRRTRRAK